MGLKQNIFIIIFVAIFGVFIFKHFKENMVAEGKKEMLQSVTVAEEKNTKAVKEEREKAKNIADAAHQKRAVIIATQQEREMAIITEHKQDVDAPLAPVLRETINAIDRE